MTTPQSSAGAHPGLKGYQALGNLMGGYPDTAIFRRFRNAGALDLLYRQAELQKLIANWAHFASTDQGSGDHPRNQFDLNFDLLYQAANLETNDRALGAQWRAWLKISDKIGEYYDRLFKFQKVCSLPRADEHQLRELRWHLLYPDSGDNFLKGPEYLLYDEIHEADLTSVAAPDEPDIFNRFSRGRVIDFYHKLWGIDKKHNIRVTQLGDTKPRERQRLEFPLAAYSPEYAFTFSRVLYGIATSFLVTFAIVTLNLVKGKLGRISLIAIHNLLFTIAMAFFSKARPGEIFGVAAAYAAVLVVYASGPVGSGGSSPS